MILKVIYLSCASVRVRHASDYRFKYALFEVDFRFLYLPQYEENL